MHKLYKYNDFKYINNIIINKILSKGIAASIQLSWAIVPRYFFYRKIREEHAQFKQLFAE